MKIKITDQWANLVKDDTLRQNSRKTYEVGFDFDGSWDGYSRTAIFEAGPSSVIVALTEDRCAIPAECLKHGSVKLKVGVYGVKGEERKGTIWCLTSLIIPDATMSIGSTSTGPVISDDVYSEIMAAIGDLSAAGFEGKTLAEIFREIKDSVCDTATDSEVEEMLDGAFSKPADPSESPGEEGPGNTAADKEVEDLLSDVFGKEP